MKISFHIKYENIFSLVFISGKVMCARQLVCIGKFIEYRSILFSNWPSEVNECGGWVTLTLALAKLVCVNKMEENRLGNILC